ncbi:hypothetical protein CVT24_005765 [Panaeolus cyanescens]|uniref:Peptidase S26 domain-containing protein n=1 Tax=Panaeolus cyanescens TaxID=181874 RepID=A0A409YF54_9AGAR|nr:hypothetical protein CVT24_005765 [Panaeolus cyanescens]
MHQFCLTRTFTTAVKRLKKVPKTPYKPNPHQHTIPPAPNSTSFWDSKTWKWGLRSLKMTGPSMLPTFGVSGEMCIEEFITKHLFPATLFTRGTLLTFHSPLDPDRYVCKRIIGLPGDVICVDPTGQYAPSDEHVVIPPGHVWVVGDNAAFSRDSREYGPLPMGLARGRIVARIWPPTASTIFRNPTTYLGEQKQP